MILYSFSCYMYLISKSLSIKSSNIWHWQTLYIPYQTVCSGTKADSMWLRLFFNCSLGCSNCSFGWFEKRKKKEKYLNMLWLLTVGVQLNKQKFKYLQRTKHTLTHLSTRRARLTHNPRRWVLLSRHTTAETTITLADSARCEFAGSQKLRRLVLRSPRHTSGNARLDASAQSLSFHVLVSLHMCRPPPAGDADANSLRFVFLFFFLQWRAGETIQAGPAACFQPQGKSCCLHGLW